MAAVRCRPNLGSTATSACLRSNNLGSNESFSVGQIQDQETDVRHREFLHRVELELLGGFGEEWRIGRHDEMEL